MVDAEACFLNLCDRHSDGPNSTHSLIIVPSLIGVLAIIVAISVPLSRLMARRAKLAGPSMTMHLQVGVTEKHTVDIAFAQSTERVVVRVNDLELFSQSFAAGFRLTRSLEFSVGRTSGTRTSSPKNGSSSMAGSIHGNSSRPLTGYKWPQPSRDSGPLTGPCRVTITGPHLKVLSETELRASIDFEGCPQGKPVKASVSTALNR